MALLRSANFLGLTVSSGLCNDLGTCTYRDTHNAFFLDRNGARKISSTKKGAKMLNAVKRPNIIPAAGLGT